MLSPANPRSHPRLRSHCVSLSLMVHPNRFCAKRGQRDWLCLGTAWALGPLSCTRCYSANGILRSRSAAMPLAVRPLPLPAFGRRRARETSPPMCCRTTSCPVCLWIRSHTSSVCWPGCPPTGMCTCSDDSPCCCQARRTIFSLWRGRLHPSSSGQ